ncbi:MAG: DUF1998 domain-containing protein [Thermoguttaceae bacterium]|jgi:hypothetical protein|nr:DUF1998 domain-containing protein [Thermoguttaceae bacterium]
MSTGFIKHDVGDLRPSQILTTFGVGSIIDLPNIAAMVMGLDDWPIHYSSEVNEERLLASVQNALGGQVRRLLTPPRAEETSSTPNAFDERSYIGVPVAPFPRWMVCPSCQLLAPLSSGLFTLKTEPYRPDRARYIHTNCTKPGKSPTVVPARFIVACPHGHLDDFPWVEFVHQGRTDCRYRLRLREGISGEAADVLVVCEVCNTYRSMASAFGPGNEENLPACRGRRPHLRDYQSDGCDVEHVRAMLQGASNSWFPVLLSALSLPTAADQLSQLVDDNWVTLEKAQSQQNIELLRQVGQLNDFAKFDDEQLWKAVEKKRTGGGAQEGEPTDLKSPEWEIFTNPTKVPPNRFFKLRPVQPPPGYQNIFNKIVLVERLREVRALIGFTRIESPGDYDTAFQVPAEQLAPLSRTDPKWVPANEVNGEGIFFEFSEDTISAWENSLKAHNDLFYEAHRRWREARNLPPDSGYPTIRYILLHSFAHAVIRQLAVECGYTAASIRERIYSRPVGEGSPMAGVLIYTAAPDSEGTLGGLVSLGETDSLGRHLDQALEAMRLCASDPLCAEHHPYRDGTTLHAAACHACLFLPETSCERGNKYLDRSVLVETLHKDDVAFFEERVEEIEPSDQPIEPTNIPQFDEDYATQVLRDFLATHPGSTTAQARGEVIRQLGHTVAISDDALESLLEGVARRDAAEGGAVVWQPLVDATETCGTQDLDELLAFCDDSCKLFLQSLAEQGKELPVVGYELTDSKGSVCADAELAWPSKKIALLLHGADIADQFTKHGWRVFATTDLENEELYNLL